MERYEGLLQERDFITAYKSRRGLGIIYLYNNMDFYAFLYFKKAFAINPYDHKVNNGLAICFARAGDFKNALRFFRRALRLNPFDPESYRNLAVLYKELNMPKVAESLLGRSALLGVFD
jgi:Flp pilus assembly protein TadD